MSKGKLFVISGASGVGKGTVLASVMSKRQDLAFSVSATTTLGIAGLRFLSCLRIDCTMEPLRKYCPKGIGSK